MVRQFQIATLALLGCAAMLGAAHAQASNLETDVRCLVLSSAIGATTSEPSIKSIAMMASLYYLGRVDAQHIAKDDLKKRMVSVMQLAPDQQRTQLLACGETMQSSGQRMLDISKELQSADDAVKREEREG